MVIRKKNHLHHNHLAIGASFLGFIMFGTSSFSYFTVLKYVRNILMNHNWTYLILPSRLFQGLIDYFGRLNPMLSSQTYPQRVKTLGHFCNPNSHNQLW